MDEDKTKIWIMGVFATALTGLYGFFINHIVRHIKQTEIESIQQDLHDHKEKVQYKDNCEEIVKRIDGNHKQICTKLDRILEKLEK